MLCLLFVVSVLTKYCNSHVCLLSSRWRSRVCLLCFLWTSKALSWKWLLWLKKSPNSGTEKENECLTANITNIWCSLSRIWQYICAKNVNYVVQFICVYCFICVMLYKFLFCNAFKKYPGKQTQHLDWFNNGFSKTFRCIIFINICI